MQCWLRDEIPPLMKLTWRGRQTLNRWANKTIPESDKSSEDHQTRTSETAQRDGWFGAEGASAGSRTGRCKGSERKAGSTRCQTWREGGGLRAPAAGSRAGWRGWARSRRALKATVSLRSGFSSGCKGMLWEDFKGRIGCNLFIFQKTTLVAVKGGDISTVTMSGREARKMIFFY